MKRREYAVKSWFSKIVLLSKKRFILLPLLILCCAGLYLFYTHPSASSTIKGKPPEALQSGGLVRGSGGNIAKILKKGFVLLPLHYPAERSFAWTARFRRLARDLEHLESSLLEFHWLAASTLLVHKLQPILGSLT